MDFISEILNYEKYGDATIYFIMGLTATIVFALRLGMALFVGDDGGDFEMDDGGGLADASDASFQVFSLLSVTAFFVGTGWMGLACRHDWNLGGGVSLLIAVGFGAFMMVMATYLMKWVHGLSDEKSYDADTAIGASGRVYLTIPAKGQGEGQIEVNVSGRRKIMRAVSQSDEIAAFTAITVIAAEDDDTLVVEVKEQ